MTEQDEIKIKNIVASIDEILYESSKIVESALNLSKSRPFSKSDKEDLKTIIQAREQMLLVKTYLNSLIK